MPQAILNDLGVDSHRDQDGSSAVAQIMETKCRELGLMQQLFDLMSQDGLVEISPILVGEDQVVDLPGRGVQSFLHLPETMRLESMEGDIWQWNRSSGMSCFRF